MVFVSKLGSRVLPMLARRGLATTALRQEVHPSYAKMKETSKMFQVNNGLNVSIHNLLGFGKIGRNLLLGDSNFDFGVQVLHVGH